MVRRRNGRVAADRGTDGGRLRARLRVRRERFAELPAPTVHPGGGWLTAVPPTHPSSVATDRRRALERPSAPPAGSSNGRGSETRAGPAGRLGRLSGLDGLRAIAVAAVLLYHSDLDVAPGGFLGVDVFFVISGYLITALLLAEWAARGTISLRGFWFRRARRLLPAVFALLAGVLLVALVALPDEVARLRSDAAAAMGYVTNWYLVLHERSYFEAIGRPSPLGHLWSLAVEEQFYLLWPPVLVGLLVLLRRQGALLVTLLLAWASAIWMAALFNPDVDPSRIYFGTDTRMFALLIGAALAFVWVPGTGSAVRRAVDRGARLRGLAGDALAIGGLASLVMLFLTLTAYDEILYQGGLQFTALVSALVIAAVVRPGSGVGRLLESAPMRWIGVRSYSIYLWHWPVFVVTRPGIDLPVDGGTALLLRLAVTLVLADLSYRLIERPIREGALGRAWTRWSARQRSIGRSPRWSAVPAGLVAGLAVVAVAAQVLAAPASRPPSYLVGTEPASASVVSEGDTAAADDGDVMGDAEPDPALGGDPDTDPNLNVGAEDALSDEDDDWVPEPTDGPTSGPSGEPTTEPADPSPAPRATPPAATSAIVSPASPRPAGGSPSRDPSPVASVPAGPDGSMPGAPTPSPTPSAGTGPDPSMVGGPEAQPGQSPGGADPPVTASQPPRQQAAAATPRPSPRAAATPAPVARVKAKVLAIGDSVMLGAARELHRQFASIEVNATVSRQFNDGIRIVRARLAAGTLPDIVVIHLGTNGPVSKRQFDQAMAALKSVPLVVFVNVKVPRPWEAYTNRTLSQNVGRYANAVLVDWRGASAGVPNAFARDGIHLNREGARAYARLIAAAIT